jgi:hypothetical protein
METLIPIFGISFGCLIAIVAIGGGISQRKHERRQLEQSRRELAAYVAEGSMTPDDAVRLLNAGPQPKSDD